MINGVGEAFVKEAKTFFGFVPRRSMIDRRVSFSSFCFFSFNPLGVICFFTFDLICLYKKIGSFARAVVGVVFHSIFSPWHLFATDR